MWARYCPQQQQGKATGKGVMVSYQPLSQVDVSRDDIAVTDIND
jgi:hypothetical protein